MARLRSQKNASAVTTGHDSSCTSSSLKKKRKNCLGMLLTFSFLFLQHVILCQYFRDNDKDKDNDNVTHTEE